MVKVSLPRVLFRTNGTLIVDQRQVEEALRLTGEILAEISTPIVPIDHFTRVDLVWQFRIDPGDCVLAYRQAIHTRIRKEARVYGRRSISWQGKHLSVRMYDKLLELTRRPGNILRVEVELHGGILREYMTGGKTSLSRLDFANGYAAYRAVLADLDPSPLPRISTTTELLAFSDACSWDFNDCSLLEIWALGGNAEHVLRVKNEVSALRPLLIDFALANHLPAEDPPVPIHIAPTGWEDTRVLTPNRELSRLLPPEA
jgi:hypothetical protein